MTMTKYTQKALNDTAYGIALLKYEIKMMRQAICVLTKTKCCVYNPDNSTIVSAVLKDLHTQIDTMLDPKINFGGLLSSWVTGFTWWKRHSCLSSSSS
jgi:hypothetical protein